MDALLQWHRYADPLTEETLLQMKADGVKRAVAFSQVTLTIIIAFFVLFVLYWISVL
jgi:hypothetical protein